MGISDKLFQMKNEKAAANLKAGQDFLATNRLRPGVTALPSGLQYEVILEGNGVKPAPDQQSDLPLSRNPDRWHCI